MIRNITYLKIDRATWQCLKSDKKTLFFLKIDRAKEKFDHYMYQDLHRVLGFNTPVWQPPTGLATRDQSGPYPPSGAVNKQGFL